MDVTIWFGPHVGSYLAGVTVPGSTVIVLEGDESALAAQMAKYKGADGRYLPKLLADHGVALANVHNVYIGSFSAGYAGAAKLGLDARDRELVRATLLADSAYGPWIDKTKDKVGDVPGLTALAKDALDGTRLFVLTATDYRGGKFPSVFETAMAMKDKLEAGGASFRAATLPPLSAAPLDSWQDGGTYILNYDLDIDHENMLKVLAPQVWKGFLLEKLSPAGNQQATFTKPASAGGASASGGWWPVAAVIGTGLLAGLAWVTRKSWA